MKRFVIAAAFITALSGAAIANEIPTNLETCQALANSLDEALASTSVTGDDLEAIKEAVNETHAACESGDMEAAAELAAAAKEGLGM